MTNSADPEPFASSDGLLRQGMSCLAREGLREVLHSGIPNDIYLWKNEKTINSFLAVTRAVLPISLSNNNWMSGK